MACGDAYLFLVRTAVGGLTFDNPYGLLPETADYRDWRELARVLSVQAHGRFTELGEVEERMGGGSFPKWNALVELNNGMTEKYESLIDPFLSLDHAENIEEAQAVVRDAICLMEKSDDGIESYTGIHPAKRKAWPWVVGTAAVIGGTALVITLVYRRVWPKRNRNPRRRALRAA